MNEKKKPILGQEAVTDARTLGIPRMLILGLQHLFAMFGATVLVPILVQGYGLPLSIQTTLLMAGLGTLLFHVCTKFKVPAFLGSSFAYLGGFSTVASMPAYDGLDPELKLAYALGGIVIAGLLYLVLALLFKVLGAKTVMRYFPPIVTGPMIIMIGLTLFINKTKAGQAMLAVSEDRGAAQLMGINVNGTIALTFAIGSALAAIAAVLLCSAYPSLTPYTGAMPGIKAFVAAVFGGIGSIPGALIGGILLGIIEILGKAYISSQMADAIVFGVLIVVLLVKPSGLLGKQIQEKV